MIIISFIKRQQTTKDSVSRQKQRTYVAMISLLLLTLSCALAAAIDLKNSNITLINKEMVQNVSDTSKFYETKFNKTVFNLGTDFVENFVGVSNISDGLKVVAERRIADVYRDLIEAKQVVKQVEEYPDYASSVVSLGELLSLSSAIGSVQETICKDLGKKFLEGVVMNKTWALRSEYFCFNNGKIIVKKC